LREITRLQILLKRTSEDLCKKDILELKWTKIRQSCKIRSSNCKITSIIWKHNTKMLRSSLKDKSLLKRRLLTESRRSDTISKLLFISNKDGLKFLNFQLPPITKTLFSFLKMSLRLKTLELKRRERIKSS
jgi:hypothetical protein